MQYERQLNTAVSRLDESLTHLYNMISKGQQTEALMWMKEGDLKECVNSLPSATSATHALNSISITKKPLILDSPFSPFFVFRLSY